MGIIKTSARHSSAFRMPPFPLKMLLVALSLSAFNAGAADLDTGLPALPADNTITTININLPRQPLDVSLKQLARQTGLSLAFDSSMASGKTAPAINGTMHRHEALRRLLRGTGLEATINGDSA